MPYQPTSWVNQQPPPMSAYYLNKLTDELRSQAAARNVTHTLPVWANGASPALTEAGPLNELERVCSLVATAVGLSYAPTAWSTGWTPARNATNLNRLENQARLNRVELDSPAASDLLTWEPPGYPSFTGYTHVTLNNTGNLAPAAYHGGENYTVALPKTEDFVLHLDDRQAAAGQYQGINIVGGRNVVLIGGRINGILPATRAEYDSLNFHAITFGGQTGILHIEGVEIGGHFVRGIAFTARDDAYFPPAGSTNMRGAVSFQCQNIRAMGLHMWKHNEAYNHQDFFVTAPSTPGSSDLPGSSLRFDKITALNDQAGIANFGWTDSGSVYRWIPTCHMKRINFAGSKVDCPAAASPYSARYHYFFSRGHTSNILDDCWVKTGPGVGATDCPPQGSQFTLRQSFYLTDAVNNILPDTTNNTFTGDGKTQGNTITFTTPATDHVYAADGTSPGFYTYGDPPQGDFCAAGIAGPGYVSPGYL